MNIRAYTPLLACAELGPQIEFYRDVLGFDLEIETDDFAFLRWGEVGVRLVTVDDPAHLPERRRQFTIPVEDLDQLGRALSDRIGEGATPPPVERDGVRQVCLRDGDGRRVCFAETHH